MIREEVIDRFRLGSKLYHISNGMINERSVTSAKTSIHGLIIEVHRYVSSSSSTIEVYVDNDMKLTKKLRVNGHERHLELPSTTTVELTDLFLTFEEAKKAIIKSKIEAKENILKKIDSLKDQVYAINLDVKNLEKIHQ